MVLAKDLIERGYFPSELPPPFNTISLSNNLSNLPSGLNKIKASSKCCRHSIPKVENSRRLLGIPNPLHYIILCNNIENNWTVLEQHVNNSRFSLTTPEVRQTPERALTRKHDWGVIAERRITEMPSSRFLVRTDISNYYPTIYTHSISWALHSKTVSKARQKDKHLLGNILDAGIRNTQDRQTMGIPIGPDTSLLISEIIGSAIDKILVDCIPNLTGFRYIDDYYFYFHTLAEAESAISTINAALRQYELDINSEKTKILALPQPVQSAWRSELSRYRIRRFSKGQKEDLVTYFSKAFEYSIAFPNDSILKYALGRFKRHRVTAECWTLFEALILKCIVAEPGVLPFATKIFLTYSKQGDYYLNKNKISEALFSVISYHAKLNHGFEVAWALWLCKSLDIQLNSQVAKQVALCSDPVVALITLDMRNVGLIPRIDISPWRFAFANANELYDEHWLLAYEAKIKGWVRLGQGNNHVANDPFFQILAKYGVSFYDRNRQVDVFDLFKNTTQKGNDNNKNDSADTNEFFDEVFPEGEGDYEYEEEIEEPLEGYW